MTLRSVLPMVEGKSDGELDLFFLMQDDAWQRTSRLLSMAHNAAVSDTNKAKSPDDFNDHAKWINEEKEKSKRKRRKGG